MKRLALLGMTTTRAYVSLMAVMLSGASLCAHDMWIEPSTFSPTRGEIVGVRFRVGQGFLGDPLPRDPALLNQFVVEDSDGRRPVVGRDGVDPAGFVRAATPGLLVVGYRSNPTAIEQTAEKFNQYLKEEGLDAVAAARARRGHRGPVREIFSRYAKSLLQSGAPSPAQGDHPLGFPLELVAERNPYTMDVGQDLPIRLMYESRPLAGALVVAINRAHPSDKLSARSEGDGRVRFRLPHAGAWLIKAVHMVEAPASTNAEWASLWASLTFELPNPSPASRRAS